MCVTDIGVESYLKLPFKISQFDFKTPFSSLNYESLLFECHFKNVCKTAFKITFQSIVDIDLEQSQIQKQSPRIFYSNNVCCNVYYMNLFLNIWKKICVNDHKKRRLFTIQTLSQLLRFIGRVINISTEYKTLFTLLRLTRHNKKWLVFYSRFVFRENNLPLASEPNMIQSFTGELHLLRGSN